ncbi:hypothetical protein QFC24_001203 [Naganishia onofrii]|uniref:Uncharacterized protein n=1 Tax=Naganishia onofrii TaxID=1851511 RepID=A0ACC2XUQ4_9TREE|nr:hypothetical protein QFC24_001203 [Naganishia onofrii]
MSDDQDQGDEEMMVSFEVRRCRTASVESFTLTHGRSYLQSVDELQQHGINVQDITKLKSAGICTILAVAQSTRKNLLKIKGLSEAKVEKLKLPMDMGGASGKVAYIDTEGTFRPDRVKAIADRFGVDAKTVAE